jgi:hypothetical protein
MHPSPRAPRPKGRKRSVALAKIRRGLTATPSRSGLYCVDTGTPILSAFGAFPRDVQAKEGEGEQGGEGGEGENAGEGQGEGGEGAEGAEGG